MERKCIQRVKTKSSVQLRTHKRNGAIVKPVTVEVDYNPREDYAVRAFVKRLKTII